MPSSHSFGLEDFFELVDKGGADAVVALEFEVYVPPTQRKPDVINKDLVWAVSHDLINAGIGEPEDLERTILSPSTNVVILPGGLGQPWEPTALHID